MKKSEREKLQKAKAAAKKAVEEKKARKAEKKREGGKPGILSSIVEIIQTSKKPVGRADILESLATKFPERNKDAMKKTVQAQLGGKKRPLRIEREKGLKLVIDEEGAFKLAKK